MEGYQTEAAQLRTRLTQVEKLYKTFIAHSGHAHSASPPTTAAAGASTSASAGHTHRFRAKKEMN